jgi:hypothetical protein
VSKDAANQLELGKMGKADEKKGPSEVARILIADLASEREISKRLKWELEQAQLRSTQTVEELSLFRKTASKRNGIVSPSTCPSCPR